MGLQFLNKSPQNKKRTLCLQCSFGKLKTQKSPDNQGFFVNVRGLERIRTAVEAFAELCLAARPRDPKFLRLPPVEDIKSTACDKNKEGARLPKCFT